MKFRGPEEQFLGWHDQFADAVFRHCVFRLSDREKAKDVTQDAFVRLWNYVAEGKDVANVRAFLFKIANNLIIDEYRRKETTSLDQMRDEEGFDVGFEVRATYEARNEAEGLMRALEGLPDKYREAIVMRHVDGMSVKDIARMTGETENVISVRIHRAIEKLKILTENNNHAKHA